MMKTNVAAVLVLSMISVAHADPFPKGDPKIGKTLVEKSCTACHVSLMGGDGSKMFTRPDHKVKNAQQLLTQIRACNTNVGTGWFGDEEMDVAAYLNQNYYHFK
jgi:mono/diheme cytochrome c family protein